MQDKIVLEKLSARVRRARKVLFWALAGQINEQVQNSEVWNDFLDRQQKEPLITHKIPDTPRSKVAQDLFTYGSEHFLVTVDYYSDYFKVYLVQDATTESVIKATTHTLPGMVLQTWLQTMVSNIQAISSPLSHENFNFSTLPVRHSTVGAMAKQSQPLRSPKIWLRRLSGKTKIFKWPCWNGQTHPTLTI